MIDLISNSVVFECKGFKSAYMHLCHLNIDLNNFGFLSMNYTKFYAKKAESELSRLPGNFNQIFVGGTNEKTCQK